MLARLLNVPRNDADWAEWSYHHRVSHNNIRQAILKQKNIDLPEYVLDPIFHVDQTGWLERNAQTHIEMDGVLGIDSNDLLDVDLKDKNQLQSWVWIHYQEHYDAEKALGI